MTPYVGSNDCLGTSLLGSTPAIAEWSVNGKATNGCPVAMRAADVYVTATMECPLGNQTNTQPEYLTPPNWSNTGTISWGMTDAAYCFDCTNGQMSWVPPYSVSITATVYGTGTDNRSYYSAQAGPTTIQMRQFPLKSPC